MVEEVITFQIIFLYLSRKSRHLKKNAKLENREWYSLLFLQVRFLCMFLCINFLALNGLPK